MSSLRQCFPEIDFNYEVLVVNNGSNDNSSEIISKYKCTEIYTKNKLRPSVARNIGVGQAKGEVLAFLDSDVLVTKEWANAVVAKYNEYSVTGESFITGDYYHISKVPSWIETIWFSGIYEKSHTYICGGNILIDKALYLKIGGFSENLETGEDVDFSSKCSNIGFPPKLDSNFYVYHEGYPKTIGGFIKRERWHGKSDFVSIRSILKSKVAIATIAFIILHVLFGLGLVVKSYSSCFFSAIVLLVLLLAFLSNNNISLKFKNFHKAIFISYSYFVGRSLSIFSIKS